MKRSLTCLIVLSLAICLTACSNRPDTPIQAESMPAFLSSPEPTASLAEKTPAAGPVSVAVPVPGTPEPMPVSTATPEPTLAPVSETPVPTTPVPATSVPAVSTPEPHIHVWSPVTEIIHHDAVTEQVKVVDQQATEGHFEGGTYDVMVCRCGAEFTSGAEWETHSMESGEGHGGWTASVRSDQVWVEGTPEVSHMETVIIQDAWDEEVVSGYVCSSCGAVK